MQRNGKEQGTRTLTAYHTSGGEEDMGVMQLEEAGLQGLQGS